MSTCVLWLPISWQNCGRNKLEINYLKRSCRGSQAARQKREPRHRKRGPAGVDGSNYINLSSYGVALCLYNRSGFMLNTACPTGRAGKREEMILDGTYSMLWSGPCSASLLLSSHYSSWLWPVVYCCWNTPTLMASDNQQLWRITDPVSPSCAMQIWGAGAKSSDSSSSLSGQDSRQFHILEKRSSCGWSRSFWRCAKTSRWDNLTVWPLRSQILYEREEEWQCAEAGRGKEKRAGRQEE